MRRPVFRALWIAQFVANVGTWAQTVGAQWLMGDLGGSVLEVALVQTAVTLPVFLLVVPAGALGDILDRRRMLLVSRSLMLAGAAGLGALTASGGMTPGFLLALTALIGTGQAVGVSVSEAIQRELVGLDEIGEAALLDGASFNVARAVGPALGGLLIAAAGPEATFGLNAVAFLGVLAVLFVWRRPVDHRPLGAERVRGALRAGARYVRNAPLFGRVLSRLLLFMAFAGGLWALLPAIARDRLGMDAGGYGLLLGCLGLGAVIGAMILPLARRNLGPDLIVSLGAVIYAGGVAVLGLVVWLPAVAAALVAAGLAWVGVQSALIAAAQVLLPDWTRARALAYFQLVLMGGQAAGALVWGVVAELAGLTTAFLVPAVGLVVGAVLGSRLIPIPAALPDLQPVRYLPSPPVVEDASAGPVLVILEWRIDPSDAAAFAAAMRPVGQARRRTGARLWGLFRDAEDPALFLETFTVATWHEHLRQHLERGVHMDREAEERARAFLLSGTWPEVGHHIWAYSSRRSPG